ncbi:MAG: hypothetical protein ABIQ92_14995 [Ornithinibacter sp.]
MVTGVAAMLLSGGAVASTLTGGAASAQTLTFAVDGVTSSATTQELATARADDVRVAADRAASNTQKSAVAAQAAAVEKAKAMALAKKRQAQAAALAKQRKADADKAARAAEREKIVANAQSDPRSAARVIMGEFGFGEGQWSCLSMLWVGESDWNYRAENPSSGAYGIPQSLPGNKMATMGSDWRSNPVTQIRWGLDYIKKSYGTPCNALNQWNNRSPHWY